MANGTHPFSLVDFKGVTRGSGTFHNYREAAHGLGPSDYLSAQGWAVIQTDSPDPLRSISPASPHA